MCTLSWLRDAGGYTVLFNRDELRSRAPGAPPREFLTGAMPALAPADGNAGGTWIGVNAAGVTLALLNRYADTPSDPPSAPVSRGILVRELLAVPDVASLHPRTDAALLRAYRPFTLAAFSAVTHPLLIQWNGEAVRHEEVPGEGLVATSSGRDQAGAERARRAAFAAHAARDAGALTALHASHVPERGAYSVCMHRSDAETVSFVRVTVEALTAEMAYVAGPPCEGAPPDVARLVLGGGPLLPPA